MGLISEYKKIEIVWKQQCEPLYIKLKSVNVKLSSVVPA